LGLSDVGRLFHFLVFVAEVKRARLRLALRQRLHEGASTLRLRSLLLEGAAEGRAVHNQTRELV